MLANLKGVYWRREAWDKVVGVIDRLLVLNPASAGERRDRGAAWSNMGRLERGVADWKQAPYRLPQRGDHEQVRNQLRRVRQKLRAAELAPIPCASRAGRTSTASRWAS